MICLHECALERKIWAGDTLNTLTVIFLQRPAPFSHYSEPLNLLISLPPWVIPLLGALRPEYSSSAAVDSDRLNAPYRPTNSFRYYNEKGAQAM